MESLTDKQRAVLELIISDWESGGDLPTHREICNYFGFSSPRAAADHLKALVRKGYLREDNGKKLRLTERALGIPVLGDVVAGVPFEAAENSGDSIPLNTQPFGIRDRRKAFIVRARGDSMIGRKIFDGDLVLCEKTDIAKERDIVIAIIDTESAIKTLVSKDGKYWLKSENPKYPELHPLFDLMIQGVAKSIIRVLAA